SKWAIDTPITCLPGDEDVAQLGATIGISRAASTAAHRTISRDTCPPSRVRPAMTIPIGDDRGDDDAAFHDVLDVGIKANEREPARHDAEDDGANDGAADPPNASRETRPADHC